MRHLLLKSFSSLSIFACLHAFASTAPAGVYNINAQTTTTGVHQSIDQGTLTGTLTFDSSGILDAANLVFSDTTSGLLFTFTDVTSPSVTSMFDMATISNASDPAISYAFSVSLSSLLNGDYTLNCGTDCDTDAEIPTSLASGAPLLNEELLGHIAPAPEPSSLLLLGTGALGLAAAARRRLGKG